MNSHTGDSGQVAKPDDIELLRRALAPHLRGDPPATPDCLDHDTLAALAEGALDPERRAAALPHLAACMRCRSVVAAVARALADPEVARELRAAETDRRGRGHRRGWIAAGVAAAAVLLLFAWPTRFQEETRPHRAPPITAAPAPQAVFPEGPVAEAPSLRWTPVPGADLYRTALFDARGIVLYEAELAGTVATLPDSVLPAPGETYWWQVEARVGFDRWVASDLIEFSVARGPGR